MPNANLSYSVHILRMLMQLYCGIAGAGIIVQLGWID